MRFAHPLVLLQSALSLWRAAGFSPALLPQQLAWWFCCLLWLGLAAPSGAVELNLSQLPGVQSIGAKVDVYEDVTRRLDRTAIEALPDAVWKTSTQSALNFAFSDSAWWVRLRLHNDTAQIQQRWIEVAQPLHDYLDWHERRHGEWQPAILTGDRRPWAARPLPYRAPVFPVTLGPGERSEVLIRLDTHDGYYSALPLVMHDETSLVGAISQQTLLFALFLGGLSALLLYNLLLLASTREPMFFGYAAYLASFGLWTVHVQGYALQWLWPDNPDANNIALVAVGIVSYLSIAYFGTTFLQTQERLPRLHRAIQIIAVPIVALLLFSLANHYKMVLRLGQPLCTLLVLLVFAGAVHLAWRGQRAARWFVLAWSLFLIGLAINALRIFNVLPTNALTNNIIFIGSTLEFVMLAFALADRINTLKQEKLQLEQQSLVKERAHREELEVRVADRTAELAVANARLQDLASHDELTGLLNRRQYSIVCATELNRARRDATCLGLIVLDIDYFKKLNDTLGHTTGDEALRDVARAFKNALRRPADYAFRVGGEEFVVLLSDTTVEGMDAMAAALLEAVRALNRPHPGHPLGIVTASAGGSLSRAEDTVSDLFARADEALYAAKSGGRNRYIRAADTP